MTVDHVINQIVEEFANDHIIGWCSLEKALDLAAVVIALRPKVVLEIGVFGGKSLIPMALACAAIGTGMVIGIDPWSARESTQGYSGDNAKWWGKVDHDDIYRGFMANLARLGLKDRITIHRTTSDEAPVPEVIDLFHSDGQHSEQAIRDVRKFAPHVRIGGVAVLDDLNWKNDGVGHVALAAEELKKLGFVELYPSGTGAFFQRTRWGVVKLAATKAPKRRAKR